MPDKVTLRFDEKTEDLIILDETGGRQIGRVHVPVVYYYPNKKETKNEEHLSGTTN